MNRMTRILAASLLLTLGIVNSAQAASFDCNKAITESEIAICNDPELSALDEGLHIAYRDIFVSNFGEAAETARAEQRNWIIERNLCGAVRSCLIDRYTKRHIDLSNSKYDNLHEPFNGSLLPSAMNSSLTTLLNSTLKDWDLVAVDSIIGASQTGLSITTAFIVREKSISAMQRCGMSICNSNTAYFALIDGSIDKNFEDTPVHLYTINDLLQDSVDVELNILTNRRVRIEARWLRGKSTIEARYFVDEGLKVISKSSGGVTSPGLGTMYIEHLDYDLNVSVKEYGYVFGGSIKSMPRIIDENITSNECKFAHFKQCDYTDAYNLGVTLFSHPDTINDALLLFDYLVQRDFVFAKRAYDQVAKTIKEIHNID